MSHYKCDRCGEPLGKEWESILSRNICGECVRVLRSWLLPRYPKTDPNKPPCYTPQTKGHTRYEEETH